MVYIYTIMKIPEMAIAKNDLGIIDSNPLKTRFETNIVAEKYLNKFGSKNALGNHIVANTLHSLVKFLGLPCIKRCSKKQNQAMNRKPT